MNPPRPSTRPAAEQPQTGRPKWAPPAWLLEVAPDDDNLIPELIDVFKTSTATSLQQMRAALAAADVPKLRTEAHRTKGSARQVGAGAFAEACQALELAPSPTPVSRLVELVTRCQELFDETESAMTSYSSGIKAGDHSAPLAS